MRGICAACGRVIGGPGSLDNVAVIRHVTLTTGKTGWVTLHVRCARGPWLSAAEQRAPGGAPLALPMLTGGGCRHGVGVPQ